MMGTSEYPSSPWGTGNPVASMKVGKKSTSETKWVVSTEPGLVTPGHLTSIGVRLLAR